MGVDMSLCACFVCVHVCTCMCVLHVRFVCCIFMWVCMCVCCGVGHDPEAPRVHPPLQRTV